MLKLACNPYFQIKKVKALLFFIFLKREKKCIALGDKMLTESISEGRCSRGADMWGIDLMRQATSSEVAVE